MKKLVYLILFIFILSLMQNINIILADEINKVNESKSIAAMLERSYIITEDGNLYGWGGRKETPLGNGSTELQSLPVKILSNVASISAGEFHTVAITSNNELYSWGSNYFGELGNGIQSNDTTLEPILVQKDVIEASAGLYTTAIIKKDGSLYVWGKISLKKDGDEYVLTPQKVMDNVKDINLANQSVFIIKNDNSLWAFGGNEYGVLGDGTTEYRYEPRMIMKNVKSVDSNGFTTAIVKTDNSLWMWGVKNCEDTIYGSYISGEELTYDLKPNKIMDGVKKISIGNIQMFFNNKESRSYVEYPVAIIKEDNSLFIWGCTKSFGHVMDDVEEVDVGNLFMLAKKLDNSIYTWGSNNYGQLGNGTFEDCSIPKKILIINSEECEKIRTYLNESDFYNKIIDAIRQLYLIF